MGIIGDVAVCAMFLLALIIGTVRGFVKQFSGLLRGLVAFVGSIILTALIIKLLQPAGFYESFIVSTSGWFKGDAVGVPVSSEEELRELLSEQGGAMRILSGLAPTLFADMQKVSTETLPCDTLALLFGRFVTNLICGFVLWLVLLLLLKLIFKGIIFLMKDITILPAFHVLDKIFGAIWAIGFTYVIMIGIVLGSIETLFIKFFPVVWESMAEFIRSTTVLLWLHDTNIIGSLLAGFLNVTIPSLDLNSAPVEPEALAALFGAHPVKRVSALQIKCFD